MNFERDENYDEELIGLVEDLKEYDNDKGYKLNYEAMREKLKPTINKIAEKGEYALERLHNLLENEETWSCLFALEILEKIKSEKSIPYLIRFIEKNEYGDYFENCDVAMGALINIGESAVEKIILHIEEGLKNEIHHRYLFEALSGIKDKRGSEFRLKILNDYIVSPKRYKAWFNLTMFICNFTETDKEALDSLKKLRGMDLSEEESRELESALECIGNPEEYKRKMNEDLKKVKPLFEAVLKSKIGRNDPCPCGLGKKYKKCCLVE